jgi:type VI secretion system protein ImpC
MAMAEAALLRAIVEAPHDDMARLIYADWLEEHGRPERAELIRVQIALTRIAPPQRLNEATGQVFGGPTPANEALAAQLRQREQELLDRFGAAWLRPLTERGWDVVLRRGLPQTPTPREARTGLLMRVRPPRVRLLHDSHGGPTAEIELPFVVGVLADLSGHTKPLTPLSDRRFDLIDVSRFNVVLAHLAPALDLRVANHLAGDGSELAVRLRFRWIDDFAPGGIIAQVEPLRHLLQTGTRLDELSRQLAAILHHPDFQRLEGTWRGLHHLVWNTETCSLLKIRVLNVSKRELSADLAETVPVARSALFHQVCTAEFDRRVGEPYGLLVGDYEFDQSPGDVALLRQLGRVAASAHAPFVAAASPRLFGCVDFTGLTETGSRTGINALIADADWTAFREAEESRYVALTLPRVLGRLPYGKQFRAIEEFDFEEFSDDPDQDRHAWMNAGWAYAACVTEAVARYGWLMRTRGKEGGKVEGLPRVHTLSAEDGTTVNGPTEIAIADRRAFALADLGFLSLLHCGNGFFAFLGAQSCHKPRETHPAPDHRLAARLDYLLCVSRFVHCFKVMARNQVGPFPPAEDCERWLNKWLSRYVLPPWNPDSGEDPFVGYYRQVLARHTNGAPLAEGCIQVRSIEEKPGCYEAVLRLRLSFHAEDPETTLRVQFDIRWGLTE